MGSFTVSVINGIYGRDIRPDSILSVGKRSSKGLVWVSAVTSASVTASGASTAILVLPADWVTNTNSGERATHIRTIGSCTYGMTAGSPTRSINSIGIMVTVADDDATATGNWLADPGLVEPEAPLFTNVWMWTTVAELGSSKNQGRTFDIDIKAKRKMTSGQSLDVSLAYNNISGSVVNSRIFLFTRTLIKLG